MKSCAQRNSPQPPSDTSPMELFEVKTHDGVTGAILELDERHFPHGMALELHWCPGHDGTLAIWMLEDGRMLALAAVGRC